MEASDETRTKDFKGFGAKACLRVGQTTFSRLGDVSLEHADATSFKDPQRVHVPQDYCAQCSFLHERCRVPRPVRPIWSYHRSKTHACIFVANTLEHLRCFSLVLPDVMAAPVDSASLRSCLHGLEILHWRPSWYPTTVYSSSRSHRPSTSTRQSMLPIVIELSSACCVCVRNKANDQINPSRNTLCTATCFSFDLRLQSYCLLQYPCASTIGTLHTC